MEFLEYIINYFNMDEKDMIMVVFFGTLFIVMVICWAVEDAQIWYRRNKEIIKIDVSFVTKVALIPFLSLVLWVQGADHEFRAKRVSEFLYA